MILIEMLELVDLIINVFFLLLLKWFEHKKAAYEEATSDASLTTIGKR